MALSAEDTQRFLSEPRNVILGTLRQDGSPQLNPMWFYWDGAVFYISTTRTRFKYRHILRDPRVTLCIDEAETLKTLLVHGRASIQENDIWDITQRIVEKYVQPQHVAARMARFRAEPRVLIVVTPDRWVSWDRSEGANLKVG